jgi:hypothetical protein
MLASGDVGKWRRREHRHGDSSAGHVEGRPRLPLGLGVPRRGAPGWRGWLGAGTARKPRRLGQAGAGNVEALPGLGSLGLGNVEALDWLPLGLGNVEALDWLPLGLGLSRAPRDSSMARRVTAWPAL